MRTPPLLCIAHRGAMGHAPENTLAAMARAIELGTPALELDVQWVDGALLVFHDRRLERTTDGSGYLDAQPLAALRALDAGQGERIPTLEEVCRLVGDRACLNVEIKGPATAAQLAAFIAALGWDRRRILVSSFDHRQLAEFKQLEPAVPLGALTCSLPLDDARFAAALGAGSVHPAADFVDRRFVDDAHRRGLHVYAHGTDHPDDIARLHALGVDGVFTGYPELVLDRYAQPDMSAGWPGARL